MTSEGVNRFSLFKKKSGRRFSTFKKYLKANVDLKLVRNIVLCFIASFLLMEAYLNLSSLANQLNGFVVSLVFGLLMTTGIYTSLHFRCSCAVFILQCASPFGLLMIFLSASWIATQEALENLIHINDQVTITNCSMGAVDPGSGIDFEMLKKITVVLHYIGLGPYVLIFIYSFCYEITLTQQKPNATKTSRADGLRGNIGSAENKQKPRDTIVTWFKHFMSFLVGVVLSGTLTLWGFEYVHRHSIVSSIRCTLNTDGMSSFNWIFVYIVFCLILLILLPFSDLVISKRAAVIKKFFDIADELPVPIKTVKSVLKPKVNRKTLTQIKNEKKIQTLDKSVISAIELESLKDTNQVGKKPPSIAEKKGNDVTSETACKSQNPYVKTVKVDIESVENVYSSNESIEYYDHNKY